MSIIFSLAKALANQCNSLLTTRLFLVLIVVTFAPGLALAVGSISGTVRIQGPGTPIANASIALIHANGTQIVQTTTSSLTGSYSFLGVTAGNYTVRVSASGYRTRLLGVIVKDNVNRTANHSLRTNPSTLTGQVVSQLTSLPVANATVNVFRAGIIVGSTTTNASGAYTLSGLFSGSFTVTSSATGFANVTLGTSLSTGQTKTLNFSLPVNPGTVTGTVRQSSGTPIANAVVRLTQNGTTMASTVTNGVGVYTLTGVLQGTYTVQAQADAFVTGVQGVTVQAGATSTVNFSLQSSPGSITGIITDKATNDVIPGATITISLGNTIITTILSDDEGSYSFSGLAPGSYTIQAQEPDYQTATTGAIIVANQTTTVNLSLGANPGSVSGAITNANGGAPIAGASISVLFNSTIITTVLSDSSGNYSVVDLAPGAYTLQVQASNFQATARSVVVQSNLQTSANFSLVESPGAIEGTITSQSTLQPIVGALVRIVSNMSTVAQTFTDETGSYRFGNLAPGTYTVFAQATDYQTASSGAIVHPNQTSVIAISLALSPGSVSGIIIDSVMGAPLAGATVELTANNTIVASAVSDNSGNYTFLDLSPGSYVLRVVATDFETVTRGVIVRANQNTASNVALIKSPGTLIGTVVDQTTTNPVASAVVEVESNGVIIGSFLTDDAGNYVISGLAPSSYTVKIHASDYQNSVVGAVIVANQQTTVNVALVPSPGSIAGTIIKQSTGDPIPSAVVAILGGTVIASVLTDPTGNYLFMDIAPGSYTIQASAEHFQADIKGVMVHANTTTTVNFALAPSPGTISGTVTTLVGGNPIVGATVQVQSAFNALLDAKNATSSAGVFTTLTDDNGSYVIEGLAPGSYSVRVEAVDFQSRTQGAIVESNQNSMVNFALAASPGSIFGTVTDTVGDPIAKALVTLDRNGVVIETVVTDPQGYYIMENLEPGSYTIRVEADDFETDVQGAIIEANQPTSANFSLAASPGSVFGSVMDESAQPISGAIVSIEANGAVVATTRSDDDGNFVINGLAPGSYTIHAKAEDFQQILLGLNISANEARETNLVLVANPGNISGIVTSAATGGPIVGAVVALDVSGTLIASAFVDPSGAYLITGIAPGSYTIKAEADRFQTSIRGVIVTPSDTATVDFVLEENPGAIDGIVTNESGDPIEGAAVSVQIASIQSVDDMSMRILTNFTALTDEFGHYVMAGLAPGSYFVEVHASNFQSAVKGAIVSPDETATVNFSLLESPGSVVGVITSQDTGDPIAGARVEIAFNGNIIASSFSDTDGVYHFDGLAPNGYTVQVHKATFQTSLVGVMVSANVVSMVDFSLASNPGGVTGSVRNGSDNLAIGGAIVELVQNGATIKSTLTDPHGNFLMDGIAAGSYSIKAQAQHFQTEVKGIIVVADETIQANFILNANPGALSGIITDAQTGNPLVGTLIELNLNGTIISSAFSTEEGRYLINGIAPGSYTIHVQALNYQTIVEGVLIQADQTTVANSALSPNPGAIAGTIRDATTLAAIPGAVVAVNDLGVVVSSGFTDPDGGYLIGGIAPGHYTIYVHAPDYQAYAQGVVVHANQTTVVDITLLSEPGSLTGTVTNITTQEPIAGVHVEVIDQGLAIASALTNDDGEYLIEGLAPGNYIVEASNQNYQHQLIAAQITANQITVNDFSLEPNPGTVTGTVMSAEGNPIAQAVVRIERDGVMIATTLSDAEGKFLITGITPGSYSAQALADNFQSAREGVVVAANETSDVTFVLALSPGSLSGTIQSETTSDPLIGASLRVEKDGLIVAHALTDSNGAYRIDGLAPSTYTVFAESKDFQSAYIGVTIAPNENSMLNFSLNDSPGDVFGVIRDSANNPIPGATVKVEVNGVIVALTVTDPQGAYSISGLMPGVYVVLAQSPNHENMAQGTTIVANVASEVNFILHDSPGSIAGVVFADDTGNPIASAMVDLISNGIVVQSKLTDSAGAFLMEGIAPNTYTLRAHAQNYVTDIVGVIVMPNEQAESAFSLQASPGSIMGSVTSDSSGDPVPSALVEIEANGQVIRSVVTDTEGTYSVLGIGPGSYVVHVSAQDFEIAQASAIVSANEITVVDFSLGASPGSVFGEVINSDSNHPLIGAVIELEQNGSIIASAFTDSEGNYSITNLAPGDYTIQAKLEGFQTVILGVTIFANETTEVNFALDAGAGSIAGKVLDETEAVPIPGAVVQLFLAQTATMLIAEIGTNLSPLFSSYTDVNGNFRIDGVPPGSYDIIAYADDFQLQFKGVVVVANQTSITNFMLEGNPGTLVGTVRSAGDNSPITNALVEVIENNVVVHSTLTDASGNYLIEGIAIGSYYLNAKATDHQSQLKNVTIGPNDAVQVDFLLAEEPGTITGTVIDAQSSTAIAGALVEVSNGDVVIASVLTDVNGAYTISGLPEGMVTVHAKADNFQSAFENATVIANALTTVNFSLASNPGRIVGMLRDQDTQAPIQNAIIEVRLDDVLLFVALGDDEGNFSIDGLAQGFYSVHAQAEGYEGASTELVIGAGMDVTVNLFLRSLTQPTRRGGGGGGTLAAYPTILLPVPDEHGEYGDEIHDEDANENSNTEPDGNNDSSIAMTPHGEEEAHGGCSFVTANEGIQFFVLMILFALWRRFSKV